MTTNPKDVVLPEKSKMDAIKKVTMHFLNNGIWKPTTTRLPIHRQRGDNRPFYEIAKELKNNDGSPRYSAAQLQRMEAIYKYLNRVGAFDRVDYGKVKAVDVVQFRIDKALNEAEDLFRKGKYKQSMDTSIKAIKEVNENFLTKLDIDI